MRSKILGVAVLVLTTAAAVWFVGRLCAYGQQFDAPNPFFGAAANSAGLASWLFADPLDFGPLERRDVPFLGTVPLPSDEVLAWMAGAFGVIAAVVACMALFVILPGGVTGSEHGTERLATKKEAGETADRAPLGFLRADRRLFNNVWYSRRCGVAMKPRTARLRKATQGTNLHVLFLGPSGAGKSLHGSKVELMQSLGAALPMRAAGPLQIPRNLAEHILFEPGMKPRAVFGGRLAGSLVPSAAPAPLSELPEWARGFDIFVTDTKGDLIRENGASFVRAGAEISYLNLIRPEEGCCYNPLDVRYVPTRETDSKDPDEIGCSLSLSVDGAVGRSAGGGARRRGSVGVGGAAMATFDLVMETSERAASASPGQLGDVPPDSSAAIGSFAYRQTEGMAVLTLLCPGDMRPEVRVELALDEALEIISLDEPLAGRVDHAALSRGEVSWSIGEEDWDAAAAELGAKPEVLTVAVPVRVRQMTVADGIALIRTISCMARNLGKQEELDKQACGDPFWDDCKLMELTCIAAALVEMYPPQYRNIPNMIRLLNMTNNSKGSDPTETSAFDLLMREWETGMAFEPTESSAGGLRAKVTSGAWVRSGVSPHSPDRSLALHCYHAYKSGAPETVQSVNISCHAAFVRLFPLEMRELLSRDEMGLDRLGRADGRTAVFVSAKGTDDTYSFLLAMLVFQAVNLAVDNAFAAGGRLPRHVRFVLDEFANVGTIPSYDKMISVLRSMNISMAMYLQSAAQLEERYGENGAKVIRENCWAELFMGSKDKQALQDLSDSLGTSTVYAKTSSASYSGSFIGAQSYSENVQSYALPVLSLAQLRRLEQGGILVLRSKRYAVLDDLFDTVRHPYYCYTYSDYRRPVTCPQAREAERFDYVRDYLAPMRRARGEGDL